MHKFVTVFRGARDGYQIPLALYEHDLLEHHISEWYSPLDSHVFSALVGRSQRLNSILGKRYCPGLPSSKVKVPIKAFLREFIEVVGRGHIKSSEERNDANLGRYAGEYAKKRGCALLSHSYYGYHALKAMGTAGKYKKVLLQVHPHPVTTRWLLSRELKINPDCRQSLMAEQEMKADIKSVRFRQLADESLLADFCIANSQFTRKSLIENGVAPNKITVVPYGVDITVFKPSTRPQDDIFRVLFVGSVVQRKGIKYLLQAWRELALPNSELIVAGRGFTDATLIAEYNGVFTHRPNLSQEELVQLYGRADIFCLPSIVEGFGLVIMEALACGTPVITTTNTAGPDILEEGKTGFILAPGDIKGLAEKIKWCYNERNGKLRKMRPDCRAVAEKYSWTDFRERLAAELARLMYSE